jgi:hypothetical protein
MKETISIKHSSISFTERVKYYVLQFVGAISIAGLLSLFNQNNFLLFLSIFSALIAVIFAWKIYQTRNYLVDFYSDGKEVKIMYMNLSMEKTIIVPIELTFAQLKNTTSRAGFNCKLWLCIDDLEFIIEKEFDWQYNEIKELFLFIKTNKKEELSEKEKNMIPHLNQKIIDVPF